MNNTVWGVLILLAGSAMADTTLSLHSGRFDVSVSTTSTATMHQEGQAVSLREETGFDETGYFWFNAEEDIDVMVRVLDGCQFNEHFWVFFGSLTNVPIEMTVVDTETGLSKIYSNPSAKLSPPVQDTQAFLTCDTKHNPIPRKGTDHILTSLDRFDLEIEWRIPDLGSGAATVGFATPQSGAFWFLDPSDLNVYAKVVDGRAINGHFWLAYTSFTGAEYTLKVTDRQTGRIRTFENALNTTTFGIDTLLDEEPSTLLYPWVSNSDQFDSTMIINNTNCIQSNVTLEANRENGDQETVKRVIPAGGFLEEASNDLFPELGNGPGYSVILTSDVPGIRGRWVTNNRANRSPSQGVAIELPGRVSVPTGQNGDVGNSILFGYLPLTNDFQSAPVIVNAGDGPTDVSLYFYDGHGTLVAQDDDSLRNMPPRAPFARVVGNLVPNATGNLSMIAHSEREPITGVAFVFNQDGDTAIGNATTIDFTPPE